MYYTMPDDRPIGQVHSLGRGKGYHFTWTMFPMEFANHVWGLTNVQKDRIKDEYGNLMSFFEFQDIVRGVVSQSFEEGLE